jgi:hypothetical protein
MERARWELYDSLGTLETIPSVLTIEHVEKITWQLNDKCSETDNFIISRIFFGEIFWDNFGGEGNLEIILAGVWESKLRIQVGEIWGQKIGDFRLIDFVAGNRPH